MATFPKIIVLILLLCNISAILCCTHGQCPEDHVKNQHDRQQVMEGRMHRTLLEKHEGDSHTITTTHPTQTHHEENIEKHPAGAEHSIESKEMDENHGIRGEKRHRRSVHLDLGYGYGYHMPLFGFHDFDYGHHHHHSHHHGHGHHHHH